MEKEYSLYGNIIAGGLGKRDFPYSNPEVPKQFQITPNGNSLFQGTVSRLKEVGVGFTNILAVVTSEEQKALAIEQTKAGASKMLNHNVVVIDDTYDYAGAIIVAAEKTLKSGGSPDDIIISTPADQVIKNSTELNRLIKGAVAEAERDKIAIIGFKTLDSRQAMQLGNAVYEKDKDQHDHYSVINFIEKPEEMKANELLNADCSAINTGILVGKISVLLEEFSTEKLTGKLKTDVLLKSFIAKDKLVVFISQEDLQWNDCGTIEALYEAADEKTSHGNVLCGPGAKPKKTQNETFTEENTTKKQIGNIQYSFCENCFFYTDNNIVIRPTRLKGYAVIASTINGKHVLTVTKMYKYNPKIREVLYNDFAKNENFKETKRISKLSDEEYKKLPEKTRKTYGITQRYGKLVNFVSSGYDPTDSAEIAVFGTNEKISVVRSFAGTEEEKYIFTISIVDDYGN